MSRAHRQGPTGPAPSGLSQSPLSQAEPLVPCAGFAIKAWDVTVEGYGVGRIYAHSRGAALAKAWRCDAFGRITFGDFLKIASTWRAMFVAEAFGEPIKVNGKPAFFVQMEGPYVAFAWPGEKLVLHSHPSDVERAASADTRPKGGDGTKIAAPSVTSGAVPEGQTPSPSPSPAAGR